MNHLLVSGSIFKDTAQTFIPVSLQFAYGIAGEGMSIANGTRLRNLIKFTRYDCHRSSLRHI
ncbi:MAG: hypothetical protein ACYST3_05200 [Planctomycetota bacterium]|jgi:hypothetical protein